MPSTHYISTQSLPICGPGQLKNKRTMMVLYRSPEQTALQTYC